MPASYYNVLLMSWLKMIFGKSYWHAAKGEGLNFQPGKLSDYYRDYSIKVNWEGEKDASGCPLTREPGGKLFHHPTTLAQKALGHWSHWLASDKKEEKHWKAFIQLSRWFVQCQEPVGAWKILSMEKKFYTVSSSALSQGQAISVLVRAFSITSEMEFLEAARRGLQFMLTPVEKGGTSRVTAEGMILEEYPMENPNTVLNGWISALFGLYDLSLIEKVHETESALEANLKALVKYLPGYNAGFWSFYDTSGTISSPYYHRVHIVQLIALERTFPDFAKLIKPIRSEFENQLISSVSFAKAFFLKGLQKLRNPPVLLLDQPQKLAKKHP